MVWYNLKIGKGHLKMTPLNPLKVEYANVDKDGNPLTRVKGTFERGHFVNETTGETTPTAYKLIKGIAMGKIAKTKEVGLYREVDLKEIDDILEEKRYLVESEYWLDELSQSGKALKFGFASGNGYKVYKGYLYPSQVYNGFLMLKLGTTQISEIVGEVEQQKEKTKISVSIDGIDRAKVEDLIEI